MNNKVDLQTRLRFRNWLRGRLYDLDFYQRRGDHYLIREFAKYCVEHGAPIDEASLGRYLRDDEPVLPTPERCRALARVLELAPVAVLIEAGYLEGDDLFPLMAKDLSTSKATKEVSTRKAAVAEAAKRAGDIAPFAAIDELVQQTLGRRAGVLQEAAGLPAAETVVAKNKSREPVKH